MSASEETPLLVGGQQPGAQDEEEEQQQIAPSSSADSSTSDATVRVSKNRIVGIDLFRGLLMVLMAIDRYVSLNVD